MSVAKYKDARQVATERYILSTLPTLYLPLYRLDGATFLSADGHGTVCTVTGALGSLRGKIVDGSDDNIDCGTDAVLDVAGADFAIGGWFNSTNTDLEVLIGKVKFANDQWGIYQSGGKYYFSMRHDLGGSDVSAEPNTTYTVGTWNHVFGTVNNGTMTLYINGVAQTITATYTGTRPVTTADIFYIARRVTDNANNLTGTVGEVYLYNRFPAGPEIQHNYLATEWRYR